MSYFPSSLYSFSGLDIRGTTPDPDKFNFLSFLATAQALQIEFLPIAWDVARGFIGEGGTSRIRQALVNIDTSFAFKVSRNHDRSEEWIFRDLTTEITILSQTFIREHPNIAHLQGICWDISPDDDKPWPVLVFEKSHFGNLLHFATHAGRSMKVVERLRLCLDIGGAIMDMHNNYVIHGDIKPQNVLIFKDKPGKFSAKVIDFGYSARYVHGDQQLRLCISEPWNAPENDGSKHSWIPSEAVQADLYSFGMICLWILFEPCLKAVDVGFPMSADSTLRTRKSELRAYAQQLLAAETSLGIDEKKALWEFFDSSLNQAPEQRDESLQGLLRKLDPQRPNSRPMILTTVEDNIRSSNFKIEKSIYDFYKTDYRVRSYIAQCLHASTSFAFQAALSYYIGFGVERNEAMAKKGLIQSGQTVQALQDVISAIDVNQETFQARTVSELRALGNSLWTDFEYIYLDDQKTDNAISRLIQETKDLIFVWDADRFLVTLLRDMLAQVYTIQGRWEEAEKLQVQVMETCKRKLGTDHPSTVTSMAKLASTYRNQGRWKEAESLDVPVIEISKTKLGADHSDTLTSIAHLALTYKNQGRWEEAEKLQVQVMETYKIKLGSDHYLTLTSMNNLAATYIDQGRWEEAEKLEVQVIETSKIKLGTDHPVTLTSMANLAVTFWNQSRWEEAEKLGVQVIKTRKTKLGADHPDTLTSMANLASTYRKQGRWKEAESLEVQVMEASVRVRGEEHPDTLTSMANLASTYRKQGRWKEAESLEVQVMETRKRVLGEEHPSTLSSMGNLALTFGNQGRWKEAESLEVQVMEASVRVRGEEHPDTLTSIANLALTFGNQGRWKEAESLEVQVMEASVRVLGEEHPDTLTSISNLASTFWNQGRWKEAEEIQTKELKICLKVLGDEHPNTLTSIANLASIYRSQGRWEEAEKLEVQVMETSKTKLGADHPDTLTSMNNLAFTWKGQGRQEEALDLMKDCAQA